MGTSSPDELTRLLNHPQLWRADQLDSPRDGLSTGHPDLDHALSGAGWPEAGLMELLCDQPGIGELRLLAPALARLSDQPRWIAWVNPPHIPYAPALEALDIDTRKLLLVHPRKHHDALWALEQALKSGTCSSALAWLDETRLRPRDIRRLQLAAKRGDCLAVLFRPEAAARHQSPAELRIALQAETPPQRDALQIQILKRRGGWPPEPFAVQLRHLSITLPELAQRLALWRLQEGRLQEGRLQEGRLQEGRLQEGKVGQHHERHSAARQTVLH